MFRIGDEGLRWSAFGSGCLAVFFCLLFAPSAFAQKPPTSQTAVRQTATKSLTLIKPSDPTFESLLNTFFPGISSESGYQKSIRPFLVLLRNNTSLPAVAYAITWTVRYPGGPASSPSAVFVDRPLMGRRSRTYLPPEGLRLVSPMFNVTPLQYAQLPSFASWYSAAVFLVKWGAGSSSVDVDLDGVAYSDGTFIGRDKTLVFERYEMVEFAARDEAIATLSRINSSPKTPLAIKGRLEKMFAKDLGPNHENVPYDDPLLALYLSDRKSDARDMRGVFRARGVIGLEAAIRGLVTGSGASAKPSVFAKAYEDLSGSGTSTGVIRTGVVWPSTSAASTQGLGQRWWRLVPQKFPPEPASASRRQLLAERGAYFDKRDGSSTPVDQPSHSRLVAVFSDPGVFCEGGEKLPFFANEAIVVATFKSYQVYLSPSHRSMYTSLKLAVDQVLEPGPSDVKTGQEIDQLLGGGTARLPNGQVLSYGIDEGPQFKDNQEKPGHRYLLFLKYVFDGNFFVEKGVWELRGGRVVPVNICDVAAAEQGESHYAFLSEGEFLAVMRQAIQKYQEGSPK